MDNKYNNPIQNRTNQQVILLADRDSIGNRKNHAVMGYATMFKKQYEPIISVNLTANNLTAEFGYKGSYIPPGSVNPISYGASIGDCIS